MDSVLILTFSGTGNTQFVVDALVQSLTEKGVKAASIPLEKIQHQKNMDDLMAADMIGIAFPVHSFNPPVFVEKVIKKLPPTITKKCFILKTAGSPFAMGGTTSRLKSILAKRHWILKHEVLVPMPANLVSRYSDSFIKLNAEMAVKQAEKIADNLLKENYKLIPAGKLAVFLCVLARVERMGAFFYGRYLKVEDNCIKCGRCVRDCPTKNIKFENGKFIFGWKCALCMKCSFFCPVQAYNHKHLGRFGMVKPPYDLHSIINNPAIQLADILDDKIPNMKDFRSLWFRAGVLD